MDVIICGIYLIGFIIYIYKVRKEMFQSPAAFILYYLLGVFLVPILMLLFIWAKLAGISIPIKPVKPPDWERRKAEFNKRYEELKDHDEYNVLGPLNNYFNK